MDSTKNGWLGGSVGDGREREPDHILRVVHTVGSVEDKAAGTAVTIPGLCQALGRQHLAVTLASLEDRLGKSAPAGRLVEQSFAHVRFPLQDLGLPGLHKLGRSPAMAEWLATAAADVYHTHGLWMMPNVYPAAQARRRRAPFMLSPHGMLAPEALTFSRRIKKLFWRLWQQRAFETVSCLHATAESEYEEIRAFGAAQPVAVIPHGIDLPELSTPKPSHHGAPYVLALSRLHPIKRLDRLIAAWQEFSPSHPAWKLRIAGPDEGGHANELIQQVAAANLQHSVSIEPAVHGPAKYELMRGAEFFVVPSAKENFGMTVAESLALETPVIATRGTPWQGLADTGSGWWIDHGVASMAAALRTAAELPATERVAMGVRGRRWMEREFSWAGAAEKMHDTYRWLAFGGTPPACVRID